LVWAFFLAPLLGAAIAGVTYKLIFPDDSDHVLEDIGVAADATRDVR